MRQNIYKKFTKSYSWYMSCHIITVNEVLEILSSMSLQSQPAILNLIHIVALKYAHLKF